MIDMFGRKPTPKQQMNRKVQRNVMERKVGNAVGKAFAPPPPKKQGKKR